LCFRNRGREQRNVRSKVEPVSTQIRAPKVLYWRVRACRRIPAARAGKNLKKSTMELGGSHAFVEPEDQIGRSPKQMHTMKADPQ
jgi:hypothetical protein